MNKITLVALKTLTWIVCLYPIANLTYGAVTNNLGPDPTGNIEFATGLAALRLLVLSLAITPLRQLWSRLSWLIKFRRLLGLFAFFYASVHLLAYVGLYAYFDPHTMLQDIAKRRFITVGVLAWLLLVPLALTSTTGAIKRLGGKRWNQLHKLVHFCVLRAAALLVAGEVRRHHAAGHHRSHGYPLHRATDAQLVEDEKSRTTVEPLSRLFRTDSPFQSSQTN
jgi:sulfoxide reductase heme-binding subunit YedZ